MHINNIHKSCGRAFAYACAVQPDGNNTDYWKNMCILAMVPEQYFLPAEKWLSIP
jgi:hypothetical protein